MTFGSSSPTMKLYNVQNPYLILEGTTKLLFFINISKNSPAFLKLMVKEIGKIHKHFYFNWQLTPCKAKQPLKDTGLQEKKYKKIKAYMKFD